MADVKQSSGGVNLVTKMDEEGTNGDPPAPRENMIATAIRFLQNPKVRESPFPQRKLFLTKKGLTEKEIEMAIERSGTAGDATAVVRTSTALTGQNVMPVNQIQPTVSPWTRWRDYTATVIVVGGVSYGLYYFIKKYLMPMWTGPSEEQKRTADLQASIKELEKSLQAVVSNLQEAQNSMKEQQETLKQIVLNSAASRGPMEMEKMQQQQYTSEIKSEIQSLKGLLLSRKQFPPTPKTTPVIPAWQLGSGSNKPSSSEAKVEPAPVSGISGQTSSESMTSSDKDSEAVASGIGEGNTNQMKDSTTKEESVNSDVVAKFEESSVIAKDEDDVAMKGTYSEEHDNGNTEKQTEKVTFVEDAATVGDRS